MEKLEYVDYLQNVEISKGENGQPKNRLTPSDPKSFWCKQKKDVQTLLSDCSGDKTEPEITCQV